MYCSGGEKIKWNQIEKEVIEKNLPKRTKIALLSGWEAWYFSPMSYRATQPDVDELMYSEERSQMNVFSFGWSAHCSNWSNSGNNGSWEIWMDQS